MGNWVVWLAAFLGFAAVLAVGVVLIAADILRAHAADRDNKRRLQQSIIEPSAPSPPVRPRSTIVERAAFALFMVSPVLMLGAAAVLAVMHLMEQNPG
jgi:hypothetical protein